LKLNLKFIIEKVILSHEKLRSGRNVFSSETTSKFMICSTKSQSLHKIKQDWSHG